MLIATVVKVVKQDNFVPEIDLLRFELRPDSRHYTDVLIVDNGDSALLYFRISSKQSVFLALDMGVGFAPVQQNGNICNMRVSRPAEELASLLADS